MHNEAQCPTACSGGFEAGWFVGTNEPNHVLHSGLETWRLPRWEAILARNVLFVHVCHHSVMDKWPTWKHCPANLPVFVRNSFPLDRSTGPDIRVRSVELVDVRQHLLFVLPEKLSHIRKRKAIGCLWIFTTMPQRLHPCSG